MGKIKLLCNRCNELTEINLFETKQRCEKCNKRFDFIESLKNTLDSLEEQEDKDYLINDIIDEINSNITKYHTKYKDFYYFDKYKNLELVRDFCRYVGPSSEEYKKVKDKITNCVTDCVTLINWLRERWSEDLTEEELNDTFFKISEGLDIILDLIDINLSSGWGVNIKDLTITLLTFELYVEKYNYEAYKKIHEELDVYRDRYISTIYKLGSFFVDVEGNDAYLIHLGKEKIECKSPATKKYSEEIYFSVDTDKVDKILLDLNRSMFVIEYKNALGNIKTKEFYSEDIKQESVINEVETYLEMMSDIKGGVVLPKETATKKGAKKKEKNPNASGNRKSRIVIFLILLFLLPPVGVIYGIYCLVKRD